MKKVILIILVFVFADNINGQNCFKNFEDYYSSIDTTDRPVFRFVEKEPEIFNGEVVLETILQSQLFKNLQCCPIRVLIGFVVEPDSTLTNIHVCPRMLFCEEDIINKESKTFIQSLTELLGNIKSAPGILNEEKVAVAFLIPIHFECRR